MTLAQLQYIVALDNFRHFAKAAEHSFVTQPTLSMQVQKLEEELGVLIFDRTKQPVIPTDVGSKIIRQARIILNESESLQYLIKNETGKYSGTLRIGIIPTIAPYLIPLFLQSFVEKYPKIELVIDEITTPEIVRGIKKGLVDIGILALPINEVDMIEEALYYEPFVVYVSKYHPLYKKEKITLDDLSRDDLLLLKEGHCLRDQTLKICSSSERYKSTGEKKIIFESGTLGTLKKLVEQNFGFTLLPFMATYDLNENGKMVREFFDPVPKREIGLLFSKSLYKRHLAEALKREILNVIPQILLENENSLIVG